ncbi:inhibitor of growth protein 5-like [Chrysoperla carnea]|uniref:inhibitor of growth protein 5-like n=1 Tax=Chrysoperla carnea TaxID=189513 RepID=UPI001D08CE29|nr:inhibitor of growth protein 5-like [Chrysoperla carnea]
MILKIVVLSHPADVSNMPVNPNEPTDFLCYLVSYEEMIGCNNPDSPIEWFNILCVGLTMTPQGQW